MLGIHRDLQRLLVRVRLKIAWLRLILLVLIRKANMRWFRNLGQVPGYLRGCPLAKGDHAIAELISLPRQQQLFPERVEIRFVVLNVVGFVSAQIAYVVGRLPMSGHPYVAASSA